jgi:hypothetical protein
MASIAMTTFTTSAKASASASAKSSAHNRTVSRDTAHVIYSTIHSITFMNFNESRSFDHDKNKSDCVDYLKKTHHLDEFFDVPIKQLVNKYYENVFGPDNSFAEDHLHQTFGKGIWKREKVVTHNETFRFIVESIERETKLLYQRPLKM